MKKRLLYLLFSCCLLCLMIFSLASCASDDGGKDTGYFDDAPPWATTDIVFQLTENTNGYTFSPTQRRFLAGDTDSLTPTDIDTYVKARNTATDNDVMVNVIYNYCLNMADFGWGSNSDRIVRECASGSPTAPDMYCNFVYDMTCAALHGVFANLYSDDYGDGMNFFGFASARSTSGNVADSERAYYLDYMRSLTLSNDRMYLLASDYNIDLLRSMLVIPVNVSMLNSIPLEKSTGDTGELDGDFDIDDFYDLVWEGGFTYDALATLSEAVYKPLSDYNPGADLGDVIGFPLSHTPASWQNGIFIAAGIDMLKKTPNGENGYSLSYPEKNDAFADFCASLLDLLNSPGVCTVSRTHAMNFTEVALSNDKVIRNLFASDNKILFGGIASLGSLEGEKYRGMIENGTGLAIAPIPKYDNEGGESLAYHPAFDNSATVIAISKKTGKFGQCTAFLDCQTGRSTELVDYYAKEYFTLDKNNMTSLDKANVEMIKYLDGMVDSDVFDQAYDLIITNYFADVDGDLTYFGEWGRILSDFDYRITDVQLFYEEVKLFKQDQLSNLIKIWNEKTEK